MKPDPVKFIPANHRTLWFDAVNDLAKLTIIIAALYWGLQL